MIAIPSFIQGISTALEGVSERSQNICVAIPSFIQGISTDREGREYIFDKDNVAIPSFIQGISTIKGTPAPLVAQYLRSRNPFLYSGHFNNHEEIGMRCIF